MWGGGGGGLRRAGGGGGGGLRRAGVCFFYRLLSASTSSKNFELFLRPSIVHHTCVSALDSSHIRGGGGGVGGARGVGELVMAAALTFS